MIYNWKLSAKFSIKGKLGILFVIELILFIFNLLVSFDPSGIVNIIKLFEKVSVEIEIFTFIYSLVISVASLLLIPPFELSRYYIYLCVAKGQSVKVEDVFYGFDNYVASLKLYFYILWKLLCWYALFIIPGIIKSYSYSMAFYVLAENPYLSVSECLEKSKEMTHGFKGKLFLLDLSFIGWNILNCFTFGLLGIWLVPYRNTTQAHAYLYMSPGY